MTLTAGIVIGAAVTLIAVYFVGCTLALRGLPIAGDCRPPDPAILEAPVEFEKTCGKPRSGEWPRVRKEFLADHPTCESCGTKDNLEAHHKRPFHLDRSKELDKANLICLCEKSGHDCHFVFGHAHNWSAFVPTVVDDAAEHLMRVQTRRTA
jgi:5-methylcytosine-specific restriction enzyme A